MENKELPPKYYLDNFNFVLKFVQDKYKQILQEQEWRFLRKYYCLQEDAQCLFIRFANRTGLFFRTNKLNYNEIQSLSTSLEELKKRGFINTISTEHTSFGKEILHIFNTKELLNLAENISGIKLTSYKKLKKEALVEQILADYEFEQLITQILNHEEVIKVNFEFEVTFIKFLFFGNRYLDMNEFVLRDLGLMQYEHHDDDKLIARFNTRKEAEDKWLISDQNDLFKDLQGKASPIEIYDWFMNFASSTQSLSDIARSSYERLILKVAAYLEKNKCLDEALSTYQLSTQAPSRERQVRILQKLKCMDEAANICLNMLANPQNADEKFFATDFLNKLNTKNKVNKSTTSWLLQSDSIKISKDFQYQVELGVADFYQQQGKEAVFSENYLWRAIFGLLFWEIIFDPSLVSFHHPFQRRPSDLYLPDFYEKRHQIIQAHLAKFDNKQILLQYLGEVFEKKNGITNPFIVWEESIWLMTRKAVEFISIDILRDVLHEMSKNIIENLRGFPDLFVWDTQEYYFVEVKSPSDTLSNQQLFWLQYFQDKGINAKVMRVEWIDNAESIS